MSTVPPETIRRPQQTHQASSEGGARASTVQAEGRQPARATGEAREVAPQKDEAASIEASTEPSEASSEALGLQIHELTSRK